MDKRDDLDERSRTADEALELAHDISVDYDGCNTVESLKDLIDEMRELIDEARSKLRESQAPSDKREHCHHHCKDCVYFVDDEPLADIGLIVDREGVCSMAANYCDIVDGLSECCNYYKPR